MKKIYTLIAVLLTANLGFSQIFTEDFQGGIPGTWTLINNDGNTPNASVAQYTDAWIIQDNPDMTGDSVAASTSWYTPAGTSDDWLISPAINLTTNNVLSWEANAPDAAYPDGYEVRISTAGTTMGDFLANPALFTIAAENSTWTSRSVDLQAAGYSNQTVHIAWRNTSTDQFVLFIDSIDVSVQLPFDAVMSSTNAQEYTFIPLSQASNIVVDGDITNNGSSALTNVSMVVDVYDGGFNPVYNASSTPVTSLAPAATTPCTVPGYTPTVADIYTVVLTATMTETDGDTTNNVIAYQIGISDSTYARDNGQVTGTLGIGAGTVGELGQSFTLITPDTLTSVDVFIANTTGNMTGQPLSCLIYDVTGGTIGSVLGSTDTILVDTSSNKMWNLSIDGGPLFLAGVDTFAVIAQEPDSNITIGTATSIFTAGKTWVNFPGNPFGGWEHNEAYNFNVSYVLRANFANIPPLSTDVEENLATTGINIYPNPSNGIFTVNVNDVKTDNALIEILDVTGKIVETRTISNLTNSSTFDISAYGAGTYFVKVSSDDYNETKKFVVLK